MAGRVRIPDLYIPRMSRYSELFSLFIKPACRHSLMLQALFAFDWEGGERNARLTFLTAAAGQDKRESP